MEVFLVLFYFSGDTGKKHKLGKYELDANTTYEEIISMLTQEYILPPIEPPLHYNITADIWETGTQNPKIWESVPVTEGQTLASIVPFAGGGVVYLQCYISISFSPPSKEKSSSITADLDEVINILTSREATAIANVVTITTALIVIAKSWSKTHQVRSASSAQLFPQPRQTDIYAIRLRMTDGKEHTSQEWLTEPDELKHFIDVFNQPSSQLRPTEVVFVQWNREVIPVDVRKGAQGNLQLDTMLKRLKINSAEKEG